MASNNVEQFATELKMPADLLLTQLRAAGVEKGAEWGRFRVETGNAGSRQTLTSHACINPVVQFPSIICRQR